MALFRIKFLSRALFNNTDVTVFIPSILYDQIKLEEAYTYDRKNKYQVIYLLHGHSGDNDDWITHTNVLNYAEERQVALVMPNALDSFYTDMAHGKPYETFVGDELYSFISAMLPVSTKRENTFIAGLSMGGYGAMKLALRHPEHFGAAITLSGALDIAEVREDSFDGIRPSIESVFGDSPIADTEHDLLRLLEDDVKAGKELPKIYQACGSDDFLLGENQTFLQKARSLNVDVTYEEEPGMAHEWPFWDKYILRALEWLPLAHGPVAE